jgi:hypothetical protein
VTRERNAPALKTEGFFSSVFELLIRPTTLRNGTLVVKFSSDSETHVHGLLEYCQIGSVPVPPVAEGRSPGLAQSLHFAWTLLPGLTHKPVPAVPQISVKLDSTGRSRYPCAAQPKAAPPFDSDLTQQKYMSEQPHHPVICGAISWLHALEIGHFTLSDLRLAR